MKYNNIIAHGAYQSFTQTLQNLLLLIVSPVNAGIVAGSAVGVVAVIASLIILGVIFGIVSYYFKW